MEKARPHLETNRKHEEDKSEFLQKMQKGRIRPEAEMAQENAHKKNPCRPQRNAFDPDLSEQKAHGYHERKQHYRMPGPLTKKQFFHKI